ncbi:MAG: enoyl-CoA hydratase/isomerase family protein, partial [Rhodospirillaceae bacterium]|nr:enoyl-CoA hydratase/isomerase family protein [Rhodospirillaceae bacterium]
MNRPQAGNSVNAELSGALDQAVEDAASDADLRALILTGAGEKFFCTGGDIKEYRAITDRDQLNAIFNRTRQALKGLETLPIPVIAAVN